MRPLQQEIIQQLQVQPIIDPANEVRRTIDFLKQYLKRLPGLKTYVLGVSGGQDSTLVARLAQLAVEELRQETQDTAYRFIAVRLPYGVQLDEEDAQLALDFIQADEVLTINIKSATDQLVEELTQNEVVMTDFNKGNIKARQRMIVQYAIAGARQGVVLGCDHAAENVTGFFTKFGDGAADLMPLWRLTKSQGAQMLQYLNANERLYTKVPTADLEDLQPLQSDEEALGVTYREIDAYLHGETIAEKAAERIESLYLANQHKRHMPITIFDDFWK